MEGSEKSKKFVVDDEVKASVKRNEGVWKEVLAARDKAAKERCMEVYKK